MLIQHIGMPERKPQKFALFNLGFRPFFLGAGMFALLSLSAWMGIYLLHWSIPFTNTSISPMQWHAHEMIYGYGLAVIAGFLLTAVKNWTGVQTWHGKALLSLFAIWTAARLLLLGGTSLLVWAALADLLFGLLLMVAVVSPIIQARQWKQMAVLSKLIIVVAGNSVFYLGALGYLQDGVQLALYGGLYITISLILVLGRRVIPFFIERGVSPPVSLKQYRWADISILVLFVAFFINELFLERPTIGLLATALLFLINGFRLYHWHTSGIWKAPLLWGLYVSSWLINLGFLLFALVYWAGLAKILAVHVLAIGGVGLMTMSMMARVALGHTGRNIKQPSPLVGYALAALVLSVIFRAGMPLLDTQHYLWWIGVSYLCWLLGFALFLITYLPILTKPRLDGQFG